MNADRPNAGAILELAADQVADCRDAIPRIFAGTLAGVLIRGVLDGEEIRALIGALERHRDALPSFHPPVFKGYVLGKPLVSASDGLAGYLDAAERFRTGCAALGDQLRRFEARIHDTMAALAAGYDVAVPRGADGRQYLTTTVRVLLQGDRLPLHYENETFGNPAMDALRPMLDVSTLMSFYLPLAIPRSGGVLRLYHTHCLDGGDSLVERLGGEERARPQFEQWGFSVILPRVGDLLVFDGGRWYHDVTPIEDGTRWTLGGFLAMTRDHRGVRYWS